MGDEKTETELLVTVSGPRGSGKLLLASSIARFVRDLGADVVLRDEDGEVRDLDHGIVSYTPGTKRVMLNVRTPEVALPPFPGDPLDEALAVLLAKLNAGKDTYPWEVEQYYDSENGWTREVVLQGRVGPDTWRRRLFQVDSRSRTREYAEYEFRDVPPSDDMKLRDAEIARLVREEGATQTFVGMVFGLSQSRVSQICREVGRG